MGFPATRCRGGRKPVQRTWRPVAQRPEHRAFLPTHSPASAGRRGRIIANPEAAGSNPAGPPRRRTRGGGPWPRSAEEIRISIPRRRLGGMEDGDGWDCSSVAERFTFATPCPAAAPGRRPKVIDSNSRGRGFESRQFHDDVPPRRSAWAARDRLSHPDPDTRPGADATFCPRAAGRWKGSAKMLRWTSREASSADAHRPNHAVGPRSGSRVIEALLETQAPRAEPRGLSMGPCTG